MGLECVYQFRVQGCDQVVIELLLFGGLEDAPGQRVDIPSVVQAQVAEVQRDCAVRF